MSARRGCSYGAMARARTHVKTYLDGYITQHARGRWQGRTHVKTYLDGYITQHGVFVRGRWQGRTHVKTYLDGYRGDPGLPLKTPVST